MDLASVEKEFLGIIKIITDESGYIGKSLDAIAGINESHAVGFKNWYISEVEGDRFMQYAEDDAFYLEFYRCLLITYSGRIDIRTELNIHNLIEHFKEYLGSQACHRIVNNHGKKKINELMEELGGKDASVRRVG